MVIAARVGVGPELDAYLAAFRVPDFIFYLVAGGALASAFIPTFTARLTNDAASGRGEEPAWRLASAVITLVLAITTVLALLAALFSRPLIAHVIAPGFSPEQQALTARLMTIMLLAPIFFGVSGILMGILQSYQHFFAPALAPVLYNVMILLAAWFLVPLMGVYGLAVGVAVGAAAHLLVQAPALLRRRPRYTLTFDLDNPDVRQVIRLMGPRMLGLAAVQINFLVNANLASRLPTGSLSALNYAWLLMLLPQGVIAQGIATAIFPTLSAQAARGDLPSLRATLNAALRAVIWLTAPATAGLFMLRVPIIQVLLQRGNFTAEATTMTAYALAFFAFGLAAHSLLEVVTRAFYALHDTWTPVKIGLAAMAVNLALSLLLLRPLSFGGLALANTVATTLEALALLVLIRPRLAGLGARRLAGSLGRTLPGAAAMIAALLVYLAATPTLAPLWRASGGILLGAAVYGLFAVWLGREDVGTLLRRK